MAARGTVLRGRICANPAGLLGMTQCILAAAVQRKEARQRRLKWACPTREGIGRKRRAVIFQLCHERHVKQVKRANHVRFQSSNCQDTK